MHFLKSLLFAQSLLFYPQDWDPDPGGLSHNANLDLKH